jgi:hypothetical protein
MVLEFGLLLAVINVEQEYRLKIICWRKDAKSYKIVSVLRDIGFFP